MTLMQCEAAQASQAVREQLLANADRMERLAERLRRLAPRAIVTCARGSSDHAATFARYLIETRLGVLTASAAPSVSSVYRARLDLSGTVLLAISQSGASPDLIAQVASARGSGALTVALVNASDSPLERASEVTIPLCAGTERSVAATKSYIASLAALVHLIASWSHDAVLAAALREAPRLLELACDLNWSAAVERLATASHLYVLGRGLGLAVAQEAALKLKETCGLHAEAFSTAELQHGPVALVGAGFPVLLLAQDDAARASIEALAGQLAQAKVPVLVAGAHAPAATVLPTLTAHPAIQPLLLAQCLYGMAGALALARGLDPDRPPHLRKITETL